VVVSRVGDGELWMKSVVGGLGIAGGEVTVGEADFGANVGMLIAGTSGSVLCLATMRAMEAISRTALSAKDLRALPAYNWRER